MSLYDDYDIEEVWKIHIASPHESSRNELIQRYMDYTDSVCTKVWKEKFQTCFPLDDALSNAYVALIRVFDRFDPCVGYSDNMSMRFTAYLRPRIRGSVYDLQEQYSMRVNRNVLIECMDIDIGWIQDKGFFYESSPDDDKEYMWNKIFVENIFNLSKDQSSVLRMKYKSGMSYPKIADVMNIDTNRAANIQKAAIAKIQRNMDKIVGIDKNNL